MLPPQRHDRILDILRQYNAVRVAELAAELQVTQMTIRRDLEILEQAGLLQRIYGGAIRIAGSPGTSTFEQRETLNVIEKRAIATAAVQLISEQDVIFLNGGTTTLEIARALPSLRNLTVITSNLSIATQLHNRIGIHLLVTGGDLRLQSDGLTGQFAEAMLSNVHINKALVGVNGFSATKGLTIYDLAQASLVRTAIGRAQTTIVVADHTKCEAVAFAPVVDIQAVGKIITDWNVSPDAAERFCALGIDVILAPPSQAKHGGPNAVSPSYCSG
jgi:DeoR family fructose operon transcriptional repressor